MVQLNNSIGFKVMCVCVCVCVCVLCVCVVCVYCVCVLCVFLCLCCSLTLSQATAQYCAAAAIMKPLFI